MVRSCPICHEPLPPRSENPAYPFCSERCRLVDLGGWLGERYRVLVEQCQDDDPDTEATG